MIKNIFKLLETKYKALKDRERFTIVLCTLVLIIIFGIKIIFLLNENRGTYFQSHKIAELSYEATKNRYDIFSQIQSDPKILENEAIKLQSLKVTLLKLRAEKNQFKKTVMPHNRLKSFLTQLLAAESGLSLDNFTDHPNTNNIDLQFHGNYFACLHFFQKLENSEWYLLFDHFDYKVNSYPMASIQVTVYTPSSTDPWPNKGVVESATSIIQKAQSVLNSSKTVGVYG